MEKINIAELLKDCPFRVTSNKCYMLECNRINLSTMKIKELEEEK